MRVIKAFVTRLHKDILTLLYAYQIFFPWGGGGYMPEAQQQHYIRSDHILTFTLRFLLKVKRSVEHLRRCEGY